MTLLLLALQTGLLDLQILQRTFLLSIILFIVVTSTLQSMIEIADPIVLALGASRNRYWGKEEQQDPASRAGGQQGGVVGVLPRCAGGRVRLGPMPSMCSPHLRSSFPFFGQNQWQRRGLEHGVPGGWVLLPGWARPR